jgi:hypothetical protein
LAGRALQVVWDARRSAAGSWFPAIWHDSQVRRLVLVGVLSVVAVAVLNPHGPALFRYSSELARHPNIPFMEEWKPLPPKSLFGYLFVASVLLLIPLLRWSPAPFTATQLLLLLGFGWESLAHNRFLVWWCMLYPWVVVPHLYALGQRWFPTLLADRSQANLRKTILAGAMVALLLVWSRPALWLLFGHAPLASQRVVNVTPYKVSRYLAEQYRKNPDLSRVVFTSETMGDYLLWDLRAEPPVRVFCYTHVHLLTPAHWLECMKVKSADYRWPQVLDRSGAQFIVVERSLYEHLIRQVLARPDEWEVVEDDPVFVARRKPAPPRASGSLPTHQ